jgi:hypothetical protein
LIFLITQQLSATAYDRKRMNMIRKHCVILFFGICLFLVGCSNPVKDMEDSFHRGQYLKAAQSAINGMREISLRPQVEAFMLDYGDLVIEKSLLQGELLMKREKDEDSILYFQALLKVFGEMKLLSFPVVSLEQGLVKAGQLLDDSIEQYTKVHYRLGKETYKRNLYRKSLDHFTAVRKYHSGYESTDLFFKKARDRAQRQLSITPFYKSANTVTEIIADTITSMLTGSNGDKGRAIRIPLRVAGVDVPNSFTRRLMERVRAKKSAFLTVSVDDIAEPIENTHYYLEGKIDAQVENTSSGVFDSRVKDSLRYSYRDKGNILWETAYFEYDLFKSYYQVIVTVEASLYLTENDKKVADIPFDKYVKEETVFRGEARTLPNNAIELHYPMSYLQLQKSANTLNKTEIVERAIFNAAEYLGEQVLKIIDKDLDPYEVQLVAE